jgi:hypothetical protein
MKMAPETAVKDKDQELAESEPGNLGDAKEAAPQDKVMMPMFGGEIRIVADAKTGSIMVNAPPNLLLALGMLDAAKFILVQKQQEDLAARNAPKIKPATPEDLARLAKGKLQN